MDGIGFVPIPYFFRKVSRCIGTSSRETPTSYQSRARYGVNLLGVPLDFNFQMGSGGLEPPTLRM